ncbi:DHHC zinc finger membrane protein [Diplocarpon rosae]|nr:DHHC zinc finger membrane protein [Diplocarpon rosae]
MDDPARAERYNAAVNKWVARVIPLLLAGIVGYATYVTVAILCVNYLLRKHHEKAAAIPILVVYFILFLLIAVTFFRLVYITILDPPVVPLGPRAISNRNARHRKKRPAEDGIGGDAYNRRKGSAARDDPDCPGLELFYTKDVFVCELDGKPKWCSSCQNWKPDRAHHDSSSSRCIRKMDHFCPWVGGPVGESNMKFFIQFNFYAALYCLHLLVVMAIYVHQQKSTEGEGVNAQLAVILGLAGFFLCFTAGMAGSSATLAMKNQTQVENLQIVRGTIVIAVIQPSHEELKRIDPEKARCPPYMSITYPLNSGQPPPASFDRRNPNTPQIKTSSQKCRDVPKMEPVQLPRQDVDIPAAGPSNQPSTEESSPTLNLTDPSAAQVQSHDHTCIPDAGATSIEPESLQDPTAAAAAALGGVSDRDLLASRTFAILSMPQGSNPWDLGSRLLNFKAVMGTKMFDWFLPLKRSPCCNHEGTESQFALGPEVQRCKKRAGLVEQSAQEAEEDRRQREGVRAREERPERLGNGAEASNGDDPSTHIEMDNLKDGRVKRNSGRNSAANLPTGGT